MFSLCFLLSFIETAPPFHLFMMDYPFSDPLTLPQTFNFQYWAVPKLKRLCPDASSKQSLFPNQNNLFILPNWHLP
jgi:hypothetical protein